MSSRKPCNRGKKSKIDCCISNNCNHCFKALSGEQSFVILSELLQHQKNFFISHRTLNLKDPAEFLNLVAKQDNFETMSIALQMVGPYFKQKQRFLEQTFWDGNFHAAHAVMIQFATGRFIDISMWTKILRSLHIIDAEFLLQFIYMSRQKDIDNLFATIELNPSSWNELIEKIQKCHALKFFFYFNNNKPGLTEFVLHWKCKQITQSHLPDYISKYIISFCI